MPLAKPAKNGPFKILVRKTEEKGSDVNLASHLLMDSFNEEFDVAMVISNDSDLVLPIRMVRKHFRKTVIVVNPQDNASVELSKTASYVIDLKKKDLLRNCQFNDELKDKIGTFRKPAAW